MGYRTRSVGLARGIAACVLGIAAFGTAIPSACAQDNASPGQIVVKRVDLLDADLQYAVGLLRQQTGVQIVIQQAVDKPYGHVTVSLEDKPLDQVLRNMCFSAGASMRFQDGVYFIEPKGLTPVIEAPVKPEEPVEKPRLKTRTEKIRLQNMRPTEVLYYLGIDQGYVNQMERMMQMESFGANKPWKNVDTRYPTLQNLNAAPSAPPIVPTASGTPNGQENRSAGPGGENLQGFGGGFGGGGRGGGGIGGGGFGGGGLGGGGLGGGGLGGGGRGGGGLGGGQGAGQALLPDGVEAVIGYDLDNSIIVVGTDEAIREMKQRVNLLDIAPKQVMVRAEFVTVSQNDLRTFGIDWTVQRGNLNAGTSGFAGGPVFLNYATGNVVAQLRATLTEGKGRLINSPMVTTLNNVPVNIIIGRQVPVFLTSPVAAGNGTVVLQTTLIPVPVFTGLFVTPRINGDDSISMNVTPFVNDIVDTVTGPDGTTAPVIATQSITVNRRIRNGETMVIGGLISKNDQTSIRKVPLLGELPLIGQLFQAKNVTIADSELLIFITPSIIRDTVAGGGTAAPGGGGPTP